MNNYKIVIDAGHGGDDPGASGNGIIEKNSTLQISQYMYDQFKKLNIPVTLIRSSDETINPEERVKRILNSYGNSSNIIVISNHINAGGGDGAEVIYALRNDDKLANIILNSIENAGQNVRKAYQKRLPSDTSKDYYFIHRDTGNTEPIIIEYGFLDSTGDDVNQLKNDYKKLVNAVVDAVAEYIGLNVSNKYYTVVKGDSLWSISKKYGLTVNELKEANNLGTNSLSIGQILIIPSKEVPPTSTNTYTVVSGDSLYSISKKFNTTVDELKSINNLSSNILSIGQVLKIPSTASTPSTNYITYTVVKGDNLYAISKKYNITQEELMKFNNLSSNLLSIGQILKIPTNSTNEITYIVKSGDSLYSIANRFNTTVNEIKSKNNLTSNVLQIGQILKIPT